MKPQTEKIRTTKRKYLGSTQCVAEARLVAKDAEKVQALFVDARPVITSAENLTGQTSYGGRLTVRAIIVDEDESLCGLNYGVDFGGKFQNELISPDVKLDLAAYAAETTSKTEGNVVLVRCVIETKVFAQATKDADVMTSCEGLNCKTVERQTAEQCADVVHSFTVAEETEVKHRIGKILFADSTAVLTSTKCQGGVLKARGTVFGNVTYQTGERNVRSVLVETPFDEEIAADGCTDDAVICAEVTVKNTKLHIEIAEDEDNRSFTLESQLEIKAQCFATSSKQVVEDAFSLTDELDMAKEEYCTCIPQDSFCFNAKAEGVAEISSVDEVLCVCAPKAEITGWRDEGMTLCAEGIMSGGIIFLSGEKLCAAPFEIPFEATADCGKAGVCGKAYAAVSEVSAKVIRGEVNVEASLKVCAVRFEENAFCAVRDVDIIGAAKTDGCALELVTGKKGMTLWDLQKLLRIEEKDIFACNPGLTLPLECDRKILLYRQIK